MLDLDRHWRDVLTVLLQNIACGQAQHREIAQTAEHIRADYQGRFLVELIQNAADQARSAGLADGRLLIVHRGGVLAVANQGAPFTDAGINSITSLGLSTKRPDESIGNKGVGFKAVFEVTDAPEIFGAASSGADLSAGLPAVRFRMSDQPFTVPGVLERARALVEDVLAAEPTLAARLESRGGAEHVSFEEHLRRAPPFKFPLPLDEEAWRGRLDQLRLGPGDLVGLETMVVLPLIDGATTAVNAALAALAADHGALALFLPGVARVEVRTEEEDISIVRRDLLQEPLGDGWYRVRETEVAGSSSAGRRSWWMAERTIGARDEAEAARVRDAVLGLPGEGWAEVRRVPVAVALPHPDRATLAMPVDGKYAIGLPTLDSTGLAWWVDGHFHGTISRKGIDLDKNPLNQLVLAAAAELIRAALMRLRAEPACPDDPPLEHFGLALSLRGKNAHLRRAVEGVLDVDEEELILLPDGEAFTSLSSLKLPEAEDRPLVLLADPHLRSPSLVQAGLRVPHPRLLVACGDEFLDCKVETVPAATYLARNGGSPSLVEVWALAHRGDGPAFWQPFLTWIGERRGKEAALHRVIPVRPEGILRPADWVFMPLTSGDAHAPPESDLDAEIVGSLHVVDSVAIFCGDDEDADEAVREALTSSNPPLVQEPHYLPLLQHSLAPALSDAVEAEDEVTANRILRLAMRWIPRVLAASDARLLDMEWRLPAEDGSWVDARVAYVGAGWTRGRDRDVEPMIASVYGRDRILMGWPGFRHRFGLADDAREATLGTLSRMGLAVQPRVLRAGKPVPVIYSGHQRPESKYEECPFEGLDEPWSAWLDHLTRYSFNWRRRATWRVVDPTWLDGLEKPGAAEALGAWVVRHPESYASATKVTLRPDGYNQTETVSSPWIYALRVSDARIIPTSPSSASRGDRCRPSEACQVAADQRRKGGMGLLHLTAENLDEQFRVHLGIVALRSAPASWVIRVLRGLAKAGFQRDNRGQEALLQRLWGRLNGALANGGSEVLQRDVVAEPMPVWRGKRVVAADLNAAAAIYIDDDPFTARYIKGFERALHLRPSRAETEWASLSAVLTRQLGAGKVLHTSKVEPDVGFEPDGEATSLMEWLERRTRMPGRLRGDLAVLLRHGSRSGAGDNRATAAFRRYLDARVQFGALSALGEVSLWRRTPKLLVVSKDLVALPERVLAESWPVVGEEWREAWMAFGRALADGRDGVERFFRERRIGEDARDEVRLEFGLDAERLSWLKPVLYVLWATGRESPNKAEFERELGLRPAEDWAAWLGHDEIAALVTREDGEDRPEEYVLASGLSWPEWQAARRALGLQHHRFATTREAFRRGIEHLVACGLALAAEGVEGELAVVRALGEQKAPAGILLAPPDDEALALAWTESVRASGWSVTLQAALAPVIAAGTAVSAVVPAGGHSEVVGEYREHEAAARERRAGELWDGMREALDALARHRGAEAVGDALEADASLRAMRSGPLANRALLRLRVAPVVRGLAPRAAAALDGVGLLGAGKGLVDLRLFARSLTPKSEAPRPPPPPAPKVAGVPITAGAAGGSGSGVDTATLMQALAASVVAAGTMDALVLACEQRQELTRGGGGGGGGGSGGQGGSRRQPWRPAEDSEDTRRATGLGGELFVFQQFRSWLPGFDEECWKSSARSQVGVAQGGDDGLGYDFEYVDATGRLAKRPGARCLIEVKASQGGADATFPMSRNEWRVAADTHASEADVYIIVRVENVGTAPRVADFLRDPFGMFRQGSIQLGEKDLWVSVAAVRVEEVGGE
jgi:hypothetical protein